MNYMEFRNSLSQDTPPEKLNNLLLALWYDGKEDWDKSHTIVQDIQSKEAAWVHAYLHRKEGDHGNAAYWYSRAGRTTPSSSLEDEWEAMVKTFLK